MALAKCKLLCCKCFQKFCCFQDFNTLFKNGEKYPSFMDICCWRYKKKRQESSTFITTPKTRKILASPSQTVMTWWILINYLFMIANLCLPYIIFMLRNPDDKKFKKKKDRQFILLLVMFAYLTYTILFEVFWLCYLHSKMGLKWSKCYYGVKLMSGALHRLMGVIQATVAAIMLD